MNDVDHVVTIAIIIELENGEAYQVLATKENKKIALTMLGKIEGSIKISKPLERIELIEKP